ncbi:hypothetical protein JRQ81_006439, partial [Phrynocephalus forsythii]
DCASSNNQERKLGGNAADESSTVKLRASFHPMQKRPTKPQSPGRKQKVAIKGHQKKNVAANFVRTHQRRRRFVLKNSSCPGWGKQLASPRSHLEDRRWQ